VSPLAFTTDDALGAASADHRLVSRRKSLQEAVLTDYILDRHDNQAPAAAMTGDPGGRYVIPVTVDDLAANGLLGEIYPRVCWERSVETLAARRDEIAGFAVASDERLEAYVLYVKREEGVGEILSLRSLIEDSGDRLKPLLSRLRAQGTTTVRFPKVHPAELSKELLEMLGFRPVGAHLLYAATLRPFENLRVAPSQVEGRPGSGSS
jgi:hypothetical protein